MKINEIYIFMKPGCGKAFENVSETIETGFWNDHAGKILDATKAKIFHLKLCKLWNIIHSRESNYVRKNTSVYITQNSQIIVCDSGQVVQLQNIS